MTNTQDENIKTPEKSNENKDIFSTANPRQEVSQLPVKMMAGLIAISLLAGGIGGAAGAMYLSKLPQLQRYFAYGTSSTSFIDQKVSLTEDSAVIDVVKKASPAVVSVVISKDLSKIQSYRYDPFGSDPFAPFFNFGSIGRSSSGNATPNVQQVGAGSGFLISSDGLILTNKHVVSDEQASYSVVTSDGKSYDAKVLTRDPVNDLALIKIDIKDAPKLDLADSSELQIGQRVIAIGNSLGQYQNTVTTGVVSGIGRSITAGSGDSSEQLSGVIQTDAAINPGNSGGPLLNIAGQVVGINTAIDQQGQLVGFAIPANDANNAVVSFQKYGHIARPFLGVRYVMITQSVAQSEKLPKDYGALILRGNSMTDFAVIPGSPADKAGLAENDIILEANGNKLDSQHTLSDALKNSNIGDEVTLKVYHKGQENTVKLQLGEAK